MAKHCVSLFVYAALLTAAISSQSCSDGFEKISIYSGWSNSTTGTWAPLRVDQWQCKCLNGSHCSYNATDPETNQTTEYFDVPVHYEFRVHADNGTTDANHNATVSQVFQLFEDYQNVRRVLSNWLEDQLASAAAASNATPARLGSAHGSAKQMSEDRIGEGLYNANTACTDKQPPSGWRENTCEVQKNVGNCEQSWFRAEIYCKQTCGICTDTGQCWIRLPTGCNRKMSATTTPTVWFVDPRNTGTSCQRSRLTNFNGWCRRSDAENHWGQTAPGVLAPTAAPTAPPTKGRGGKCPRACCSCTTDSIETVQNHFPKSTTDAVWNGCSMAGTGTRTDNGAACEQASNNICKHELPNQDTKCADFSVPTECTVLTFAEINYLLMQATGKASEDLFKDWLGTKSKCTGMWNPTRFQLGPYASPNGRPNRGKNVQAINAYNVKWADRNNPEFITFGKCNSVNCDDTFNFWGKGATKNATQYGKGFLPFRVATMILNCTSGVRGQTFSEAASQSWIFWKGSDQHYDHSAELGYDGKWGWCCDVDDTKFPDAAGEKSNCQVQWFDVDSFWRGLMSKARKHLAVYGMPSSRVYNSVPQWFSERAPGFL